jgi:hypothetical protein
MYTTICIYNSFSMTDRPIVVYIRLYLLMMGLDTPETCRGLMKYTKNFFLRFPPCIMMITFISRLMHNFKLLYNVDFNI